MRSVHQIAEQLIGHLGPTLVATLSGTKDRKTPETWTQGEPPSREEERRLRVAFECWEEITSRESDGVARAWFIGTNPILGEVQPVRAIREGKLSEALAAAEAFE